MRYPFTSALFIAHAIMKMKYLFFINLVGTKVRRFNLLKVKSLYCLYVEDFFIRLLPTNVDSLMQHIKTAC